MAKVFMALYSYGVYVMALCGYGPIQLWRVCYGPIWLWSYVVMACMLWPYMVMALYSCGAHHGQHRKKADEGPGEMDVDPERRRCVEVAHLP